MARDNPQGNLVQSLKLRLLSKQAGDSRPFDNPVSNNIGGLIIVDIGDALSERGVIIKDHSYHFQRISKTHPKYMSLQYPLLFPYGEDGFHDAMPWNSSYNGLNPKRQRVLMRAYYAYQIQERRNHDSTVLKGGRLFQQYLVDAYATLEEDRLDYARKLQKELRSESYHGLLRLFEEVTQMEQMFVQGSMFLLRTQAARVI